MGRSIQTTKKNTKAFLVANKEIGLELHVCGLSFLLPKMSIQFWENED